jgi:hypothetical protein
MSVATIGASGRASCPCYGGAGAAAAAPSAAVPGVRAGFHDPWEGLGSIEEGLDAIRSTPVKRVRAEVSAAYADVAVSAARRRFAAADPQVLDTLVTAMRSYLHQVLAPDWPALQRTHRRFVGEAASRYALAGADGVLTGLHRAIRWPGAGAGGRHLAGR